jgi:amidohydrolase
MKRDDLWKKAEAEIERQAPAAFEVSDWEAAHPEIGGEERSAVQHHRDFLEQRGFSVELPAWNIETAYKGVLKGSGAGRKAALMVEYDALEGLGHGCGHNVHGAMSLLAAAGLAAVMPEIPGELQVLGTPAEETYGGKVVMAERGAFDGLDFAIMIHSAGGYSYVPDRALACRGYEFTFEGKSAHAAGSPWNGRSALNGARLLLDAMDMWRLQMRPETRIHGIITEGGAYPNIMPERAVVRFHLRAPDKAMEDELVEKALNSARGAALCTETRVSWKLFEEPFDSIKPNAAGERMVQAIYDEMGIPTLKSREAGGSTDVGNASWRCPAMQPLLDITDGVPTTAHTREFVSCCTSPAVHPKIVTGAKILAKAVLTVLTDDETAAAIMADFKKQQPAVSGDAERR